MAIGSDDIVIVAGAFATGHRVFEGSFLAGTFVFVSEYDTEIKIIGTIIDGEEGRRVRQTVISNRYPREQLRKKDYGVAPVT